MSEGHRFGGFGEDDPASRRGPGVTGQRGDEEPDPEQRAEVREIDLTEENDEERDPAKVEAAERVERLREAAREEDDGQATVLLPPAEEDQDAAEDVGAGQADAQAPRPYEVGATPQADAVAPDREEPSQPVGAATVDISPPADEVDRADEPPAATTLAPAAPPSPAEGDQAAAAQVEGGAPQAGAAGAAAARPGALLATDAEAVRRQFIDIQAGFVDEPRQAVEQAGGLVEELHQKVLASLEAERGQLNNVLDRDEPSTEDLRLALRAYRAYVDRLLGLHL